MRRWSRALWILPFGLALLAVGIWADQLEAALTGLVTLSAAILWHSMGSGPIGGGDLAKRLRPSRRTVRVLAFVLAFGAAVIGWGLYQGRIPVWMLLFMLGFLAAAPILAFPYLIAYRITVARAKPAEAWPRTRGKVLNAFMLEVITVWPAPIVIYTYTVEGRTYRKGRVRFGGTGFMKPAAAREILDRHKIGTEIDVYYDPERPGRSVLIPGQEAPGRNILLAAAMSGGVALLAAFLTALMIFLGQFDVPLTAAVAYGLLS